MKTCYVKKIAGVWDARGGSYVKSEEVNEGLKGNSNQRNKYN